LGLVGLGGETVREDGRAKQRIIKNLGRKEALAASGALERLASSVARDAERAVVVSQIETGNPERLACQRIGAVDHDPDRGTTHRTQAQAENVEG
jgi:hypothetical protein